MRSSDVSPATRHPIPASLALGLWLCLGGCGHEYVCPDPIGRIVRDDCEDYRTRYESLKVQLGFSIGKLGFSMAVGKEKLRDPSELLQVVMQQTMALCKDFNTCRVPPADYGRRREESDRKFTAITAIAGQLKGDLDAESKAKLVAKLIEVITGSGEAPAVAGRVPPPRAHFSQAAFRSATSIWFGSRFQPPAPQLPPGVPVVASWEVTNSVGMGDPSSYVHLILWGKTEVDDRVYLSLSDPPRQASEKVAPNRDQGQPSARSSFHFEKTWLKGRGTMTLWYRPGATGTKHEIGRVSLDPRTFLSRGFLSYLPDPVQADPVEYERPWLVFYTRVNESTRVTVRCEHDGKPLEAVLVGESHHSPYEAGALRRHHVPLPLRVPLKGGRTRGTWHRTVPGEKIPQDLFPAEAAGLWTCRASLNGRLARRLEVRFRADGSVVPHGAVGKLSPPWWPIKTDRVENDLEKQREAEILEEESRKEAAEKARQDAGQRREEQRRKAEKARQEFLRKH